ncbi:MAG: hypothetical protein ABIC68_03110 [Candidatus Omnitrophota bacterium]
MNNKIKMLLVGLAVLCAISLVVAFQLNAVNKSLRSQFAFKEQEYLQEKQSLNQQLSSVLETKKKLDVEIGDLRAKFDSVAQERDKLKDKFDFVTKERGTLVERVQELAKQKKELEDAVEELKKTKSRAVSSAGAAQPYVPTTTSAATSGDDAYWANLLREKASLEMQVKNLSQQSEDYRLKAEEAMEEGRKLDLQYKTVAEAKGDLERRLEYNEKLAEALSEDLVREKRDKKAVVLQLENLRQENFQLKNRLVAVGDKKTSLESKVVDLQQEREILAKRLSELDSILQDRVDQIIQVKDDLKAARVQANTADLRDSRVVQLQPIVVKAQQDVQSGKALPMAGQVLAVNDENNFVIIDLGQDDGIKVGQTFSIFRNSQKIASVEVIQARKEISAADIKQISSGSQIKIGDVVS